MRAGASAAGALQLVVVGEGFEGDEAGTFGGVVGVGGAAFRGGGGGAGVGGGDVFFPMPGTQYLVPGGKLQRIMGRAKSKVSVCLHKLQLGKRNGRPSFRCFLEASKSCKLEAI